METVKFGEISVLDGGRVSFERFQMETDSSERLRFECKDLVLVRERVEACVVKFSK
jgi:hypothetical protein